MLNLNCYFVLFYFVLKLNNKATKSIQNSFIFRQFHQEFWISLNLFCFVAQHRFIFLSLSFSTFLSVLKKWLRIGNTFVSHVCLSQKTFNPFIHPSIYLSKNVFNCLSFVISSIKVKQKNSRNKKIKIKWNERKAAAATNKH